MVIPIFERWLKNELLAETLITLCVGRRVFNSFVKPKVAFPYLVFQIIPLEDRFGQARTTIQTRVLCDVKIITKISDDPVSLISVDAAVETFKERVRLSRNLIFEGKSISVRHERPISIVKPGATGDEQIITRGSTYRAWIS